MSNPHQQISLVTDSDRLSPAASQYQRILEHRHIVLLTDGFSTPFLAKTAISLLKYRPDSISAVLDRSLAGKSATELFQVGGSIPVVTSLDEVPQADSIYIGIAPPGGKLPPEWKSIVRQGLSRGLDVVSGLHDFLADDPEFASLASAQGTELIDVRRNQFKETAKAMPFREGCLRIHAVGHDCSVGKMVVTLEIEQMLKNLGHDAKFLATGQTGIMISGEGVPVDCVISDFVNGAAEDLVRNNQNHEIVLIEGQGSIAHPSFSAVTLGLLHGAAPDGLIFCYEAGRTHVKGLDHQPIANHRLQMEAILKLANLRHPCRFIGVAVNTRTLSPAEAANEISSAEQEFGLPACDVYRQGPEKLVNAVLKLKEEHSR